MTWHRFGVLSAFSALTTVNGFSWLMFGADGKALRKEYRPNIDEAQIDLLSSWQPIIYIFAAPIIAVLLVRPNGLRTMMRFAAVIELIGATIKMLSSIDPHNYGSLVALHMGQIFSAFVSPIAIGAPSHLAALWFPPEERTRATGSGVLCNNVGNALGYFVIPSLAAAGIGYSSVILLELCMAIAVALMCFLLVPPDPVIHRALTDDGQKVNALQESRVFLKTLPCLFLCFAYAWSSGGYVAWNSMFDDMLESTYSDDFIGILSGVATLAYVVGGVISSALADGVLKGKLKQLIFGSSVIGTVFCVIVTLSLPVPSGPAPIQAGKGWLVFVMIMSGMSNGAAAPLFYEVAAEMSFPISEGVSGSILSLFENVGSLSLLQIVSRTAKGPTMNIVYTVGMVVTCAAIGLIPMEYHRTIADENDSEADEQDAGFHTAISPAVAAVLDAKVDGLDAELLGGGTLQSHPSGGVAARSAADITTTKTHAQQAASAAVTTAVYEPPSGVDFNQM